MLFACSCITPCRGALFTPFRRDALYAAHGYVVVVLLYIAQDIQNTSDMIHVQRAEVRAMPSGHTAVERARFGEETTVDVYSTSLLQGAAFSSNAILVLNKGQGRRYFPQKRTHHARRVCRLFRVHGQFGPWLVY